MNHLLSLLNTKCAKLDVSGSQVLYKCVTSVLPSVFQTGKFISINGICFCMAYEMEDGLGVGFFAGVNV